MKAASLFGKWYSSSIDRRPVLTKSVTCGVISFAGDAICQQIERRVLSENPKRFDFKRSAQFSAIGMIYIAPLLHINYSLVMTKLFPVGSRYMALKKVAFDQSIFAPLSTAGFFIVINLMDGKPISKGVQDIHDKLWTALVINWQMWIPA